MYDLESSIEGEDEDEDEGERSDFGIADSDGSSRERAWPSANEDIV